MTFTEAAEEVLRLAAKPLHYKKITEIAIERNLLSHVGKTPEITMSSRLATMVRKDRGDAPIIKVKPGVFGLREITLGTWRRGLHGRGFVRGRARGSTFRALLGRVRALRRIVGHGRDLLFGQIVLVPGLVLCRVEDFLRELP